MDIHLRRRGLLLQLALDRYGRHRESDDLTSGHSIGSHLQTSSSEGDLALAANEVNVTREGSTMFVAPCVRALHKRHLTAGLPSRACNAARACEALTAGPGQIALAISGGSRVGLSRRDQLSAL